VGKAVFLIVMLEIPKREDGVRLLGIPTVGSVAEYAIDTMAIADLAAFYCSFYNKFGSKPSELSELSPFYCINATELIRIRVM
jgi:hypothetical protein